MQSSGYMLFIEFEDMPGNIVQVIFHGKVSGLEAMHLRIRQVFQERLSAFG